MLVDHLLNIAKKYNKIRETSNLKHLYKNELGKACFGYNAVHSDNKDLGKTNISVKILKSKAYEIEGNCNYDGYQRALASTVCTFFDKKTGSGISVNEQIADELPKAVIKKILRVKILNI